MALLILFILALFSSPLAAANPEPEIVHIFFDPGFEDHSIAILDQEMFKIGDLYGNYRVKKIDFNAVVIESLETQGSFRFPEQGEPDEKLKRLAHHNFIAEQMKAISDAQRQYLMQYNDRYSPDLETLIAHGFLPDGFQDWTKQGYHFRIEATGQTERQAPSYDRQPTFLASAEPIESADRLYFSVDHLGHVRYGDTAYLASWGPVWDYWDPGEPRQKIVEIDSERTPSGGDGLA